MKCFVLAASLAVAFMASPARAEPLVKIFDARRDTEPSKVTDEVRARLERVLSPTARRAQAKCTANDEVSIVDVAKGSFTRPGAQQQAVLYEVCTIARMYEEQGIAVIEAGRIVADLAYVGNDFALRALPDIDGNGLSEIVVYDSASGGGYAYGGITLLELPPKGVRWIGSFSVAYDNCGATDDGKERAAVLYASRGPNPAFFKETFVQRCEAKGAWRKGKARRPVKPKSGNRETRRLR